MEWNIDDKMKKLKCVQFTSVKDFLFNSFWLATSFLGFILVIKLLLLTLSSLINFMLSKSSEYNRSRSEIVISMSVFSMRMFYFILHGCLVFSIEDDTRSTLLHIVNATILIRSFAFTRLQVFETVVEQHCAAFVIRQHLNVISYISSNERWINTKKR